MQKESAVAWFAVFKCLASELQQKWKKKPHLPMKGTDLHAAGRKDNLEDIHCT